MFLAIEIISDFNGLPSDYRLITLVLFDVRVSHAEYA